MKIRKWGNSLVLRVAGVMAKLPKFKAGTQVTVDLNSDRTVAKPTVKTGERSRFPYSESLLLAGMTPEKAHADALAKPMGTEAAGRRKCRLPTSTSLPSSRQA